MGALVDFYLEYQNFELNNNRLPSEITHHYETCACLKSTEQKQVYLIRSKTDGKKYVLKSVVSKSHENLEKEYKLHDSLSHPGLVPAHEYIKGKDCNYFIREYMEGHTITEMVEMAKEGCLSEEELRSTTLQLCDILHYLHTLNPPVIHRDIKPDNIIYTKQGECKLIDFGISRRYANEQEKDTVVMGTEFTAPPEQFGYKQTDARSDIYSIGVLMFYMATGSLDIREIEQYTIPLHIKKCIEKCTEFSPEDRFETVKQLEENLLNCDRGKRKKVIIYLGVGVALLISLLFAGSWYLSENNRRAEQLNSLEQQKVYAPKENTEAMIEAEAEMTSVASAEPNTVATAELNTMDTTAVTLSDNTPYKFESSLIEDAVRKELGKSDTEVITVADLDEVNELYVCGEQIYNFWYEHFVYGVAQYMTVSEYSQSGLYNKEGNITSLNDIANMKNLQTLALYKQNISDLTPLSNLTNITSLGLGANNINDLTPLEKLKSLTSLDLSGNPIINNDLEAISKLPYLEDLDLGDTKITDLREIKGMKLRSLSIFGDNIRGCEGLEEMTTLEKLITTGVENTITEEGLKRIVSLPNLSELRIMGGTFQDISMLTKLTKLTYLDLCACKGVSLEGLNGLNLTALYFDETQVNDLSGIKNFPDLNTLGIRNIPCTDYTPILSLNNLQYISCNTQQSKLIQDQTGKTSYQFYLSN